MSLRRALCAAADCRPPNWVSGVRLAGDVFLRDLTGLCPVSVLLSSSGRESEEWLAPCDSAQDWWLWSSESFFASKGGFVDVCPRGESDLVLFPR